MPTVRLHGGPSLSYREWGRPDAAVVLLLHGLTSSSLSWRNVAPVLGNRFRVIALDARGHGDSEWTHDYSFELMRDDVARFMERLGILAAIVVGHSMGAITAYQLAASRPELIRLLVLEEMRRCRHPIRPIRRNSCRENQIRMRTTTGAQ
jgi:pimeloyl-ACP methyl ester carboxylesterase